jgi:carboxyl-terminal processing protease
VIQRPGGVNPEPQMVVTPDHIRRAQEALKARGYDPGAVSGNLHAGTQEALRKFQKANNLPVTGVLDQKTGEKLGIDIQKGDSAAK